MRDIWKGNFLPKRGTALYKGKSKSGARRKLGGGKKTKPLTGMKGTPAAKYKRSAKHDDMFPGGRKEKQLVAQGGFLSVLLEKKTNVTTKKDDVREGDL